MTLIPATASAMLAELAASPDAPPPPALRARVVPAPDPDRYHWIEFELDGARCVVSIASLGERPSLVSGALPWGVSLAALVAIARPLVGLPGASAWEGRQIRTERGRVARGEL